MRPRGRGMMRDEQAVSVVIATVLLVGIAITALVTVQRSFVPQWERDWEVEHMRLLERQVAGLKGELDRQVAQGNGTTVASPLSLARERASVLGNGVAGGSALGYNASQVTLRLASNQLRVLVNNGTTITGINEQWNSMPGGGGGTVLNDATGVHNLRLRFDSLRGDEDGPYQEALLTVRDPDGNFQGDLKFYRQGGGDDDGGSYFVRVRAADGTVLYDNPVVYSGEEDDGPNLSPYWLNAMNPDYRFDQVLGASKTPYDVTLSETNAPGDYAASYNQRDPTTGEDVIVGGGSGVVHTNYDASWRGGALRVRVDNARFVPQTYMVEHGAVVLVQPDGAVFAMDPPFRVARAGTLTNLALAVPTLTGNSTSMAGVGTALVHTTPRAGTSYLAEAPRISVTLDTSYPALWAAFWRGRMEAVGFTEAAGHFAVTTTATSAALTLYGTTTDPASTEYDLVVSFRQAPVEVAFQR